jgi:hypothetical protein
VCVCVGANAGLALVDMVYEIYSKYICGIWVRLQIKMLYMSNTLKNDGISVIDALLCGS